MNKALCAIQAQKINALSQETYSCVKSQKKGKFQIDQQGEHKEDVTTPLLKLQLLQQL